MTRISERALCLPASGLRFPLSASQLFSVSAFSDHFLGTWSLELGTSDLDLCPAEFSIDAPKTQLRIDSNSPCLAA